MSGFEKDVEDIAVSLFQGLVILIKALLFGMGRGVKSLRNKKVFIIFLVSILIGMSGYAAKEQILQTELPKVVRYIIICLWIGFPIIALILLGHGKGNLSKLQIKYQKIFEQIGFKGRDGKVPLLCSINQEDKKEILIFSSMIPVQEWKKSKSILETVLDRNILLFESGKGKQVVKITTVPSSCIIPEIVYWKDSYIAEKNGVIVVGQGALKAIVFDLNRTPHVLIAGETGSGKSVILRACLWQMINQGAKVFMFDFKGGVEFGKQYEKYGEVVIDRERALEVLEMLTNENQYRLSVFRDLEVKNLPEYNQKTGQNLCRIGVFCDEIAQMLDKTGINKKEREIFEKIQGRLSTLARLSRATGINLFLGVQRPDANVVTGQIKNNIPVRICGRFADKAASEIVLGNTEAVDLPDIKGRFLYRAGNEITEFQSYLFEDEVALQKEIKVEIGDMLTEVPVYREVIPTQTEIVSEYVPEKIIQNQKPGDKHSATLKGGDVSVQQSQKEIEQLLREMDDYDSHNLF